MMIFLATITLMTGLFAELHIIEAGIAVVPMLFLFCGSYDFAYMPLFIAYPAEILPFQLRAKGLAITLTTDSLACFFNQYVNPVAFTALHWKYFSLYLGCLAFFMATVYLLFPETQDRTLEEVARIFESKDSLSVESSDDEKNMGTVSYASKNEF